MATVLDSHEIRFNIGSTNEGTTKQNFVMTIKLFQHSNGSLRPWAGPPLVVNFYKRSSHYIKLKAPPGAESTYQELGIVHVDDRGDTYDTDGESVYDDLNDDQKSFYYDPDQNRFVLNVWYKGNYNRENYRNLWDEIKNSRFGATTGGSDTSWIEVDNENYIQYEHGNITRHFGKLVESVQKIHGNSHLNQSESDFGYSMIQNGGYIFFEVTKDEYLDKGKYYKLPEDSDKNEGDLLFSRTSIKRYIEVEQYQVPILEVPTDNIVIPDPTPNVPSPFAPLQNEVCDSFFIESIGAEQVLRVCPSCIIDSNAPSVDWHKDKGREEVWLDTSNCRYTVALRLSGVKWGDFVNLKDESTSEEERASLKIKIRRQKIKAVKKGISLILQEQGKSASSEFICAYPSEEDETGCDDFLASDISEEYRIQTNIPSGQNDGTFSQVFGITEVGMQYYNLKNALALEIWTRSASVEPIETIGGIGNKNSRVVIKISVPSALVEILPSFSLTEKEEIAAEGQETGETSSTPTEVMFKGSDVRTIFKKEMPQVFKTFAEYQSFFFHTQQAKLRKKANFDPSDTSNIPYYASFYSEKFELFYSELKGLLEKNNFELSYKDNAFRQAYEVKIIFEGSVDNPLAPFTIKKVRARYLGCPFINCSKGFQYFKNQFVNEQTLMGYIAEHDQSPLASDVGEAPPWLDYLVQNTYPTLSIEYGNPMVLSNTEAQGCLENTPDSYMDILDDALLDINMTFSKALEFSLNSLNCSTLEQFDPVRYQKMFDEFTFFNHPDIQKVLTDYQEFGESISDLGEQTWDDIKGAYQGVGEGINNLKQAQMFAKTKETFARMIKEKQTTDKRFFERLTGKKIGPFMKEMKGNSKEKVGELLQKIHPCNWEALTLDITHCMMKGMKPLEVLRRTATGLLGGLSPRDLGKVFAGLPQQKQDEIDELIKDTLGDLTPPWQIKEPQKTEADDNEYQVQMDNPDNPPSPNSANADHLADLESDKQQIREEVELLKEKVHGGNRADKKIKDLEKKIDNLNAEFPTADDERQLEIAEELTDAAVEIEVYKDWKENLESNEALLEEKKLQLNQSKIAILEELQQNSDPNEYSAAAQKIVKALTEAYIDVIVDSLNVDELKDLIDSLPGSELFAPVLTTALCPAQGMFDTWLDASIASININPCGKSSWKLPGIPRIPEIPWLDILKTMLEMFLKKLIAKVIAALVAFLMKVLQKILDDICDIFQGIGAHMMSQLSDEPGKQSEGGLFDAIADAFCDPNNNASFANSLAPEGYSSGAQTFGDLFVEYGGRVPKETVHSWGLALSEQLPSSAWSELIITGAGPDGSSLNALNLAWEVTEQFPQIVQGGIANQQDLQIFFALIGNRIGSSRRQRIIDTLSMIENDQESLAKICQLYCGEINYLSQDGFSENNILIPDEESFAQDFEDLLRGFFEGPDSSVIDALDFDGNPFGSDPYCEDLNDALGIDEVQGASPLLNQPQELKDFKNELTNSVLRNVEISYVQDLIEKPYSFFNNLLADKDNRKLVSGTLFDPSHEFRERNRFLFPNAANDTTEHQNKWQGAGFMLRLAMRIADNISDAVEVGADENTNDGNWGAIGEKVINFLEGLFVKPFKMFIELFKLDKPTPTNLFPSTVGKQYLEVINNRSVNKMRYHTQNEMAQEETIEVADKTWTSLGFTSYDVEITKPALKKADISFKYHDKGEDSSYQINVGYSGHLPDISNGEGYEIFAIERQSYQPKLSDLFGPSGEGEIKPENGMASSVLKDLLGLPAENVKVIERVNHFQVPINISPVWEDIHAVYFEKFKDGYGNSWHDMIGEYCCDPVGTRYPKSAQGKAFILYVQDRLNYKIALTRYSTFGDSLVDAGRASASDIYDYSNLIFSTPENYVNNIGAVPYDSHWLYDRICTDIFKNLTNGILMVGATSSPYGFTPPNSQQFGYKKNKKIQFSDLLYVNPDASKDHPETWTYDYENEDMVLGKSATENPRVLFLDPEIYGGTYKRPKIYVKPVQYKGYLGLMQNFLPEIDGCEPARETKLFLSEIEKLIKNVESKIPSDKRLSYDPDCVREPPFDLIADASSHAHIHGIVVLTIRAYIIEFFLRCSPVLLSMSTNENNFDDAIFYFIIQQMEAGLKDTPENNRFKKYSRETYWYLFLEQMVQTTQREVVSGNIAKDQILTDAFETLLVAKKTHYQPDKEDKKVLKKISRVSYDSNGNITDIQMKHNLQIPDSYQERLRVMINAISFNAFGPNYKQFIKNKNMKFHAGRILTMKQIRRYCKIYTIWQNEQTALTVSSYLVNLEIKKYMKMYAETDQNKETKDESVYDIFKYVLNNNSFMCFGPNLKAGIKHIEERDIVSNSEYGNVLDIVDNIEDEIPASKFYNDYKKKLYDSDREEHEKGERYDEQTNGFLVEKYVRIFPKLDALGEERRFFVGDNYFHGRKMSVAKFQEMVQDFNTGADEILSTYSFDENAVISDFFGNAQITENTEKGYSGTIGIKFGVQLSYVHNNLNIKRHENLSAGDGKVFLSSQGFGTRIVRENSDEVSTYHTLPLAAFEQDILDVRIQDFFTGKALEPNIGQNLKCYIDRLCETPQYKYVMEYLLPIKQVGSVLLINSYYGFINSIGQSENERYKHAEEPDEEWKSTVMKETKEKLRSQFSNYYDAREYDKEKGKRSKASLEFMKISMPRINMNMDYPSIRWWQRKRFHDRPFNERGEECLEGAVGSFNQRLPDEGVAYVNQTGTEYVPPPEETKSNGPAHDGNGDYGPPKGGGQGPGRQWVRENMPQNYDPNNPDQGEIDTDGPLVSPEDKARAALDGYGEGTGTQPDGTFGSNTDTVAVTMGDS